MQTCQFNLKENKKGYPLRAAFFVIQAKNSDEFLTALQIVRMQ